MTHRSSTQAGRSAANLHRTHGRFVIDNAKGVARLKAKAANRNLAKAASLAAFSGSYWPHRARDWYRWRLLKLLTIE
jgi:hypothetical protein